ALRTNPPWYVQRALSGWRKCSCGIMAGLAATLTLAACGGGSRQDVAEPTGSFPVQASAAFPASQRLSQHTHLVIKVRNAGTKPIPDIAVTISNPAPNGTGLQPFAQFVKIAGAASHSRPVWIVDHPPDRSAGSCGYTCSRGGA